MDRLLPLRVVARLLSVRRSTLLAWIESGEFPGAVQLPSGALRWRASVVTAWLASLTGGELLADAIDLGDLPPMAQEIIQALAESEEEHLRGPEIAAKIGGDVDSNSGTFGRSVRALKQHKPPLIEADRRGYRLTEAGRKYADAMLGSLPGNLPAG